MEGHQGSQARPLDRPKTPLEEKADGLYRMQAGAKSLEGKFKNGEGRQHAYISPDKKCFYSDDPNCVTELGTVAWGLWAEQIKDNMILVGKGLYDVGHWFYLKSVHLGKDVKDWYTASSKPINTGT